MYITKQGILFFTGEYPYSVTPTPTSTPTGSATLELQAFYSSQPSGTLLDIGSIETNFPVGVEITLLNNDPSVAIDITSITLSNPAFWFENFVPSSPPTSISPLGGMLTYIVGVSSTAEETLTATMTINHDGVNTPYLIDFTVTFISPPMG